MHLTEKMRFEQRLERAAGMSHADGKKKCIQAQGTANTKALR